MTPEPSQDTELVEDPREQKDEFNKELEFFTMTPEPYHDTKLIKELQQQEDEVNQKFSTPEPISSEILAENPSQPRTANPEVELIPDVNLGEEEQM